MEIIQNDQSFGSKLTSIFSDIQSLMLSVYLPRSLHFLITSLQLTVLRLIIDYIMFFVLLIVYKDDHYTP